MAEALALAASVIAVIQITNTVTKTASTYVRTLKGAASTLVPLIGKVEALKTILVTIKTKLEQFSDCLESLTLQNLRQPLNICRDMMERMKERLENVTIVGGCVIGVMLDKRTTTDLKHLDDLIQILQLSLNADSIASIHSLESKLNAIHLDVLDQTIEVRNSVQVLHEDASKWKREADIAQQASVQEKQRNKILQWLDLADSEENHSYASRLHRPGTGSWFFESMVFSNWKDGQSPHLWLSGMGQSKVSP